MKFLKLVLIFLFAFYVTSCDGDKGAANENNNGGGGTGGGGTVTDGTPVIEEITIVDGGSYQVVPKTIDMGYALATTGSDTTNPFSYGLPITLRVKNSSSKDVRLQFDFNEYIVDYKPSKGWTSISDDDGSHVFIGYLNMPPSYVDNITITPNFKEPVFTNQENCPNCVTNLIIIRASPRLPIALFSYLFKLKKISDVVTSDCTDGFNYGTKMCNTPTQAQFIMTADKPYAGLGFSTATIDSMIKTSPDYKLEFAADFFDKFEIAKGYIPENQICEITGNKLAMNKPCLLMIKKKNGVNGNVESQLIATDPVPNLDGTKLPIFMPKTFTFKAD